EGLNIIVELLTLGPGRVDATAADLALQGGEFALEPVAGGAGSALGVLSPDDRQFVPLPLVLGGLVVQQDLLALGAQGVVVGLLQGVHIGLGLGHVGLGLLQGAA